MSAGRRVCRAYHIRPRKGVFLFWGEKCARPDINKVMTGEQKTREEKRKEFLQEVRRELDSVIHSHRFWVRVVRACVAAEIELLIEDRFIGAVEARWFAYRALCQAKTQVDPEDFHEALCAFDLGAFAASLWVHFTYFREDEQDIIYQIWHARKDFLLNLDDVFHVISDLVLRVRGDRNLGLGFYYALKRPNGMYAAFGESFLYHDKPIGHILSEVAMKRLKKIFRAYVRQRKGDAGRRPKSSIV